MQERLAALEGQQAAEESPEMAEMRRQMAEQERALALMEERNKQLESEYQAALARQVQTEEEIDSAGGRVSIPYYDIRSPNVRRREAILLRQRAANY